jgi:hypothetical protein
LKRQALAYLFTVVVLVAASGASCPTMRQQLAQPAPVVFTAPPSLQQVVDVVNANSAPIQQLQTDTATLSVPGMPSLRASIAMQRPRNFRLRASFIGMGRVLDLGSNDQLFWALVDAPQLASALPKAVYYARHDQFRHSAARQVLPIQPDWLIDAFGVVQLSPAATPEGPYAHGPGQLEIRTRTAALDGDVTRVIVMDDRYGWILEQHWYDSRGQLIGSVFTSNHRYDPVQGVSLPHRVEVRLPPPHQPLQIEVQGYSVNQLYGDPAQLWTMPVLDGYPLVDLAAPSPAPPQTMPPVRPAPLQLPASLRPYTGYRPQYRGYTTNR